MRVLNNVNTGPFSTGGLAKIYAVAPRTVSKWFDKELLGGSRIPGSQDRRFSLDNLKDFARRYPNFNHPDWLLGLLNDDDMQYNDGWIQTYTGRKFYFLRCTPDDIDLRDIARALSHLCRFTGHTKFHYSVAQHSYLVAKEFPQNPMLGLMHDAVEAYINDMSRPLKHLGQHELYKKVNDHIEGVIYEKFDVKIACGDLEALKIVDTRMLVTEAHDILPTGPHPDWTIDQMKYPRYPEQIEETSCDDAMTRFEKAYREIIDGRY